MPALTPYNLLVQTRLECKGLDCADLVVDKLIDTLGKTGWNNLSAEGVQKEIATYRTEMKFPFNLSISRRAVNDVLPKMLELYPDIHFQHLGGITYNRLLLLDENGRINIDVVKSYIADMIIADDATVISLLGTYEAAVDLMRVARDYPECMAYSCWSVSIHGYRRISRTLADNENPDPEGEKVRLQKWCERELGITPAFSLIYGSKHFHIEAYFRPEDDDAACLYQVWFET